MCRATTITISGYSSSGRKGRSGGCWNWNPTNQAYIYVQKRSNEIINKITEKCGKAERKMILQFFHHRLSVPFRQVKIRFEKCCRIIISKSVRHEINSPILIWYSECVWRKAKWVLEAMERNECRRKKNPKYIFAVTVKEVNCVQTETVNASRC